jgi:hypothetical protein
MMRGRNMGGVALIQIAPSIGTAINAGMISAQTREVSIRRPHFSRMFDRVRLVWA